MIDLKSNLDSIEKLMQLMETYRIDEVACDFINIKKSRFLTPEPTDKELLDQHTQPTTLQNAQEAALSRIQQAEAFMNGNE